MDSGRYHMNTSKKNGAKPSTLRKLATISQGDLPNGRKGKHHPMLLDVLEALVHLEPGRAIKVPLGDYAGSIPDIRSAVHRATKKLDVDILTSSDDEYFYVWKPGRNGASK